MIGNLWQVIINGRGEWHSPSEDFVFPCTYGNKTGRKPFAPIHGTKSLSSSISGYQSAGMRIKSKKDVIISTIDQEKYGRR